MFELTAIVAIIVGVTEAIKRTGYLPAKFAALVAIVLGVGAMFIVGDGEAGTKVFEGIIAGLSAAGLYSGTKATLK